MPLPPLTLKDLGQKEGGITSEEASKRIARALVNAAVKQAASAPKVRGTVQRLQQQLLYRTRKRLQR